MITAKQIKEYREKMKKVKKDGFKAKDFKALARELRDKFNLTDRQAIEILNGNNDTALDVLANQ